MLRLNLNTSEDYLARKLEDDCESLCKKLSGVHAANSHKTRVSTLIDFLQECYRFMNTSNNQADKQMIESEFLDPACHILCVLLNVSNQIELSDKIAEFKQHAAKRSTVPVSGSLVYPHWKKSKDRKEYLHKVMRKVSHQTLRMDPDYEGESKEGVNYLDEIAREQYRVYFNNGKLYKLDSTSNDLSLSSFSTRNYSTNMFIIGLDGAIYTTPKIRGVMHHSSLSAGGRVLYAGLWEVNEGSIVSLDNWSGHYTAGDIHINKALAFFRRMGAFSDNTRLKKYSSLASVNSYKEYTVKKDVPNSVLRSSTPQSIYAKIYFLVSKNVLLYQKVNRHLLRHSNLQ